jgi:hypothetical protein
VLRIFFCPDEDLENIIKCGVSSAYFVTVTESIKNMTGGRSSRHEK